jgi:hypothetical protein
VLAFNPEQIGEMQQFNQFAGSLAGAGLGYAVNGKMTLNVLNFGFLAGSEDTALNRILSTGLLEMRLGGEDGFSMSVGTAGTDVSFGTVATAMVGLGHWGKSLDIKEMAKRNMAQTVATETQKMLGIGDEEARQAAAENLAVAMRGAYGFGDEADLVQLDSILRGGTQVRVGEKNETVTVNGARNVTLAGLMDAVTDEQKLALAVALSHEARRDGVVTADNNIETRGAVLGHTEMAVRMRDAGYNIAADPLIALDLAMYDYAKSVGDMSLMDLYADLFYRSERDYMEPDWDAFRDAFLNFLIYTSEQIEPSTNKDGGQDYILRAGNQAKNKEIANAMISGLAGFGEFGSDILNTAIILYTGGALDPNALMNLGAKELKKWAESEKAKSTSRPDSRKLARNMEAAGEIRPNLSDAHHIVAGGAGSAKVTRDLLKDFGIDINDADNGVFLTRDKDAARATKSQTAVHRPLHSEEYYVTVETLLGRAKNEAEARAILRDIKNQLLLGGL